MDKVGVKWVGPIWDTSGYAIATKNNILSLHAEGVKIKVEPHCFEHMQVSVGTAKEIEILSSLVSSDIKYDIIVSQLTPDMAVQHLESNKYNIAYFAWESTVVHPKWVSCLNRMHEVWVPSEWNISSLKNSGVIKPIFKIPHSLDPEMFKNIDPRFAEEILSVPDSTYLFYSVFQWQPRKNPEALLRSYFNAFSASDNVALVLKTYVQDGSSQEQGRVSDMIRRIKRDMLLSHEEYPKVFFIGNKISDGQIAALHMGCDCLVSMHASEGWGLVPFEAGLAGNPVIATGATGNMEFMNSENSYPIDYQWEYVNGMSSFNGWYLGNGLWASPNQVHASELMRYVFANRSEAAQKGIALQSEIKEKFSHQKIARLMKSRIEKIRSTIL